MVRSDLAIDYALDFCQRFQAETKEQLEAIKETFHNIAHFDVSQLPKLLTASGGIVFQKSGQPFITANEFAEKLCKYAKALTKQEAKQQSVGPAALAYHKLSSVMAADVDSTLDQVLLSKLNGVDIYTGTYRFLVEPSASQPYSFAAIKDLILSLQAPERDFPITTSKWRKLLGHMSQTETDNLSRTLALYEKHASKDYLNEVKQKFAHFGGTDDGAWWYWPHPDKDNTLQTVISDLIILERYWLTARHRTSQPTSDPANNSNKEIS